MFYTVLFINIKGKKNKVGSVADGCKIILIFETDAILSRLLTIQF